MQTLLFEMTPRDGHEDHYFTHAAKLRPILMQHDGLLFIERYRSLSRPGVILSHSLWRDEAAITRWRTDKNHHNSQTAGRYKHFEDYRIRISHALRSYTNDGNEEHWEVAGMYADPSTSADRFIAIVRTGMDPQSNQGEVFESVSEDRSYLWLREFSIEQEGQDSIDLAIGDDSTIRAILARVSRDYGMFERAEAPQYFPPVKRSV